MRVSRSVHLADLVLVCLEPGFACSGQVGVWIPSEARSPQSTGCAAAESRGRGREQYVLGEFPSFPSSFFFKCHSPVLTAGKKRVLSLSPSAICFSSSSAGGRIPQSLLRGCMRTGWDRREGEMPLVAASMQQMGETALTSLPCGQNLR